MKHLLKNVCLLVLFWNFSDGILFAQKATWIEQYSIKNVGQNVMHVDSLNNLFVAQQYFDTVVTDNFGSPISFISKGSEDIVILKYNCERILLWSAKISGNKTQIINSFVVSHKGDIFITGEFTGTTIFENGDNTTGFYKFATGFKYSNFLAKINSNGVFEWVYEIPTNRNTAGNWLGLNVDFQENIILYGYFNGSIKLNSLHLNDTITIFNQQNSNGNFIAKLNKQLILQFVKTFDSAHLFLHSSIDLQNNIYFTGKLPYGTTHFDSIHILNNDGYAQFIAKIDAMGKWLWVNYTTSNITCCGSMNSFIDYKNNFIYLTFNFYQDLKFYSQKNTTLYSLTNPSLSFEILILKLDLAGKFIWGKPIGGLNRQNCLSIGIRDNSNIIIGGQFDKSITINSNIFTNSNYASTSAFLAELNPQNGNVIATKFFVNEKGDVFTGRIYCHKTSIYINGMFTNDISIDKFKKVKNPKYYFSYNGFICHLKYDEPLEITLADSLSICRDSSLLIVKNKTTGTYHWFLNDTFLKTTHLPSIYVTSSGKYFVLNEQNCLLSDTSNVVTIYKNPIYQIIPSSLSVCKGDSVTLSVQSNASKFLWRPTGIFSNDTLQNPSLKAQVTRYIYLTSSLQNCHQKDSILLNVANINLRIQPISPIKRGQLIQLFASGAESYTWTPNQFISDTSINNPVVNPPETKLYRVTGTTNNCKANDSVFVIVVEAEDILLPSAFTPQGDGINETFAPAIAGSFDFIKLSIYSRWGELIHQTNYPSESNWWDGTYKNVACQAGVYSYTLEAKSIFGKEYQKSGTFTLLR